jgi:hypothetical protein
MTETITNIFKISTNSNGLHVIKKLVSLTLKVEYEKYKVEVVKGMSKSAIEMAQDPYANYVLQMVLDSYPPEITSGVMKVIKRKTINLSLTRYSSNVVERCIEKADEKLKEEIIKELMNAENLSRIMKNRFGTQIIQRALAFAKPVLKAEFTEKLQSTISSSSRKTKGTKGGESNIQGAIFYDQ